jgi:hypothetical protein
MTVTVSNASPIQPSGIVHYRQVIDFFFSFHLQHNRQEWWELAARKQDWLRLLRELRAAHASATLGLGLPYSWQLVEDSATLFESNYV